MKLKLHDITNKHKGTPCVVAAHGPSLNDHLEKIEELQSNHGFLRISVNSWYNYFSQKPDYWVVANSEYTIRNSIVPNYVWDSHYKWEKDVFNKHATTLFFNDPAENASEEFVKENLNIDYLPYDTRHFQGMKCRDILKSFKEHYEINKNFDFKKFGNNSQMWDRFSTKGTNCHPDWARFAGGWSRNNSCCGKINQDQATLQEELQRISGHSQHVGPGVTVAWWALSFAIIMGCNPIYIAGMDLDYSQGYAKATEGRKEEVVNKGAVGHWKIIHKNTIRNDLRIMKESAELLGIKIINLNKNSWFDVFEKGELE
jgi:hypothetical protein